MNHFFWIPTLTWIWPDKRFMCCDERLFNIILTWLNFDLKEIHFCFDLEKKSSIRVFLLCNLQYMWMMYKWNLNPANDVDWSWAIIHFLNSLNFLLKFLNSQTRWTLSITSFSNRIRWNQPELTLYLFQIWKVWCIFDHTYF